MFARIGLLILTTLIAAGCLPVITTTPIGTTQAQSPDKALYGTWIGRIPDQAQDLYFHFMAAKDGGMTVAMISAAGGEDDGWSVLRAQSASLGANRFLNAEMMFDRDAPVEGRLKGALVPVLYLLKGRTLKLYLIDEDKAKAAIQSGALAGKVEDGAAGDITITADAQTLDEFMTQPQATGLFRYLMTLKRAE